MKFVERADIDHKKWNLKISESKIENIFQYTWYLDTICSNWGAIIKGDYETILPVPYSKKLGLKQMIHARFTREYVIIGSGFNWDQVILFLSKNFKGIHFRNQIQGLFPEETKRQHQLFSLSADFEAGYKTNAKRLIKKSKSAFTYRIATNTSVLLNIFKETVWNKIESISENDLINLENLMQKAIETGHGEMIIIDSEEKVVGAGFFLKDKSRITYLKSACFDDAKKQGAMFGLLNFALQKYKGDYQTFDFGGSDVESVATFYHKFGAEDRIYFDYTINNLPLWFKTLKKIRK